MSQTKSAEKKLTIEFDISELTPAQVRLIRSLNTVLAGLVTTDDEGEFFEASAEMMRACASLIKQSKFTAEATKSKNTIPYGDQALEYSIDTLQEQINNSKVVTYDN